MTEMDHEVGRERNEEDRTDDRLKKRKARHNARTESESRSTTTSRSTESSDEGVAEIWKKVENTKLYVFSLLQRDEISRFFKNIKVNVVFGCKNSE